MKNGFFARCRAPAMLLFAGLVLGPDGFASTPRRSSSAARLTPQIQAMLAQEHVQGELLVQIADDRLVGQTMDQARSVLQQTLGRGALKAVSPLKTDGLIRKFQLAKEADLGRAITLLKPIGGILHVEPNYVYHAVQSGIPNDIDFEKLWGIRNTGQTDAGGQVGTSGSDIHVTPVWELGLTGSRNVLVAVIDTGIDWNHPDLAGNMFTNEGEIAGDGIDNDKNGFVDDWRGWNFSESNNNPLDDHDHGTHCSGTVGGHGDNRLGVAGVNWQVSLLPVKFLSAAGSGTNEGAIDAINYARLMGAKIMSNSWGGGAESEIMQAAIQAARDQGILFVAAAGNDSTNIDAVPSYPASYQVDNVLAVAATDNKDQLAYFSNYGLRSVHVAAPGVQVYSTLKGSKYGFFSGTSMATPHIAGIAALLLSVHPEWTYSELKDRLIRTSDPVRALRRKVAARGRVNVWNALNGIVPPTDEPDESLWVDAVGQAESTHPYVNNIDQLFELSVPGVKYIRVVFEKVDTERGYDKVTIQSPAGEVTDEVTGTVENYVSDYVSGDKVVLRWKTDASITSWGFKVSKVQVIRP